MPHWKTTLIQAQKRYPLCTDAACPLLQRATAGILCLNIWMS